MAGLTSPAFVQSVLSSLWHTLACPVIKKQPIIRYYGGPEPSLADLKITAPCLWSFTAFLHNDEVAQPSCDDVSFYPVRQIITIKVIPL